LTIYFRHDKVNGQLTTPSSFCWTIPLKRRLIQYCNRMLDHDTISRTLTSYIQSRLRYSWSSLSFPPTLLVNGVAYPSQIHVPCTSIPVPKSRVQCSKFTPVTQWFLKQSALLKHSLASFEEWESCTKLLRTSTVGTSKARGRIPKKAESNFKSLCPSFAWLRLCPSAHVHSSLEPPKKETQAKVIPCLASKLTASSLPLASILLRPSTQLNTTS